MVRAAPLPGARLHFCHDHPILAVSESLAGRERLVFNAARELPASQWSAVARELATSGYWFGCASVPLEEERPAGPVPRKGQPPGCPCARGGMRIPGGETITY